MRLQRTIQVLAALGLASAAVATGPLFGLLGAPTTGTSTPPPPSEISINGLDAGRARSISGGDPVAGGGFSDVSFLTAVPIAGTDALGGWLWGAVAGKPTLKDLSLVTLDASSRPIGDLQLTGARIKEIDFPELDASGKDAGSFGIKLSPTSAARHTYATPGAALPISAQKAWSVSSFRVAIDGLPTTRVSKVSAMVILPAAPSTATTTRIGTPVTQIDLASHPASTDFTLTVANVDQPLFSAWATSVLTQGHTTDTKNGSIQLLDASLAQVVQSLTFTGLVVKQIQSGTTTFTIALHAATVSVR